MMPKSRGCNMLVQFGGPYATSIFFGNYLTDEQYTYAKTTQGNIQCPEQLVQVVMVILYFYFLII
jgi:hypothetical protein